MSYITTPTLRAQSETSVVISFGDRISEEVLAQISSWNSAILATPFPGLIETVPAYVSLTIYYDPLIVMANRDMKGEYASEKVLRYLKHLKKPRNSSDLSETLIEIPVCYDTEFGPDLEETAALHGISTEKLVQLHTEPVYKVYMLGFMPGFAYLGGMNKLLATPRKSSPRPVVPAGTVGIAGEQTGIYPLTSPGGWQLIGRTPLKLFDPSRSLPTLLKAGISVKFYPIPRKIFSELSQ
jgi:inhibitor of KinA